MYHISNQARLINAWKQVVQHMLKKGIISPLQSINHWQFNLILKCVVLLNTFVASFCWSWRRWMVFHSVADISLWTWHKLLDGIMPRVSTDLIIRSVNKRELLCKNSLIKSTIWQLPSLEVFQYWCCGLDYFTIHKKPSPHICGTSA